MIERLAVVLALSGTGLVGCIGPGDENVDEQTFAHTPHYRTGEEGQGILLKGDVVGLDGVLFTNVSIGGKAITNVHLEKGELVGTKVTLRWPLGTLSEVVRGLGFKNARMQAVRGATTYSLRIDNVTANPIHPVTAASYDPTGGSFFYRVSYISQYGVPPDSYDQWSPLCDPDVLGKKQDPEHEHYSYDAIASAGVWNAKGNLSSSTTRFTFGCMSGAIGKCGGFGYLPWKSGAAGKPMSHMIQACTRMVRADYCGDGHSNTYTGTAINGFDTLPVHYMTDDNDYPTPSTMSFEAAWRPEGAVCLSRARWLNLPPPEGMCGDDTLGPFTWVDHDPGAFERVQNFCDTPAEALAAGQPWLTQGPPLFLNESYIQRFPSTPIILQPPIGTIAR